MIPRFLNEVQKLLSALAELLFGNHPAIEEVVTSWTPEDLALFDAQWKAFVLQQTWLNLPPKERFVETPDGTFRIHPRYPKGSWGGQDIGWTEPPDGGRLFRRTDNTYVPDILTYAEFRTRYQNIDALAVFQGRIDRRQHHQDLTDVFYELEVVGMKEPI